ncbi:MAG: SpoIID/LytB domain-containing protein [Endomicrobium sp.]|jgi:stage II sporulation protein D|nr:SpoIID/LytB domain-containing protein [Endomicrobium sp.]
MRKKFCLVLVVLCIYLFAYNIYASSIYIPFARRNISVGIIVDVSSVSVGSSKTFFVSDSSKKKIKLTKGTITISCCQKGVQIGKYNLSLPIQIKSSNGIIFANSKPYRGYLTIKKIGNKINVINVLHIEDYVKGVLPAEIGTSCDMEALKVQVIISRTFALANLGRHANHGFNICSTQHCQVYRGAGVESNRCNKAISETKNEVLAYDEKLANTFFHANCGGHTESPKHVWNWKNAPSYLKGVKCGYCAKSPGTNWERVFDESFVREKFSDNNIGKIKKIKVVGKTPGGNAKKIEIIHSKGNFLLNAYKFRITVDHKQIKSLTFDNIKTNNNKIYFTGRGFGHKVGLCQWGAKVMAGKGKKYKKILQHYYPKTKITRVNYK